MSLALWVGPKRFEVGSPSFLKAFFSTVFARLEDEEWGARYPTIMHELYSGELEPEKAEVARRELNDIRLGLANFAPSEIVWDFEQRTSRPPWGDNISSHIKSLADYFVTSDGRNLIDVVSAALAEAHASRQPVTLR